MDITSFQQLLTPPGQEALQVASLLNPREVDFLSHFQALSKRFPRELARAALETAILRLQAIQKFPRAKIMYFTRIALEQASSWAVSTYRATRYRDHPMVLDLGCSIGGDTLALVERLYTVGVDREPLRLAMARANLLALGLVDQADIIAADLNQAIPFQLPPRTAAFFDPARRHNGRRLHSVSEYIPPLGIIENWLPFCPDLGVKLSPAVNLEELKRYDAEVEFISLDGELKEAVLWFGALKSLRLRATVLPGTHTLASVEDIQQDERDFLPLSEPRAFIYEPDPAVMRAGLVQQLGRQLDAAQLDPDIAYLTADHQIDTPFARSWQVDDWIPFGVKRTRAFLRERQVGRVTVKKRGSPIMPEEFTQMLRLNKDHHAERILFLTHLRGRPIVIIAYPSK